MTSSSHAHLRDKPGKANWAALAHRKTNKPQFSALKALDHRGRIACRCNRKCQKLPGFFLSFALSVDQNRALASRLTPVNFILCFHWQPLLPGLPVQRENVGKISISEKMRKFMLIGVAGALSNPLHLATWFNLLRFKGECLPHLFGCCCGLTYSWVLVNRLLC